MKIFTYGFVWLLLASSSAQAIFTDVASTPYAEAINDLARTGTVQGYDDETYRPDEPINRAEFVKILLATKHAGQVEVQAQSSKSCFTDVPSPAWYRPYVCTALDRGIIGGYPDGSFQAINPVSKAEAAKILHNVYFTPPTQTISPWYQVYLDQLDEQGLKLNLFNTDPGTPLTRGEMAFAIQQFEVFPSHTLIPPSVDPDKALIEAPATVPRPEPEPEPEPLNQAITDENPVPEPSTDPADEVSPLRVFTEPHPGQEVVGGYISDYHQWKDAGYEPNLENHKLSHTAAANMAAEVLQQINDARVAEGGTALAFDQELQDVSQNFAAHLVINAVYSHSDMLGQDPFERAQAAGIQGFVAESMVWRKQNAAAAVSWWQGSNLHWNNITNQRYTRAGVGVAQEPGGSYIMVLLQGE